MEFLADIAYLVSAVALLCSLIVPAFLERKRRRGFPGTKSFFWGYIFGFVLCGLPAVFAAIMGPGSNEIAALLIPIYLPIGIFVMARKRWAAVVGTLISLVPLFWITNSIYFWRRWDELSREARNEGASPQHAENEARRSNLQSRVAPPPLPTDPKISHPPPFSTEPFIFLGLKGETKGPFTVAQVKSMWRAGEVPATARYWHEGMSEWKWAREYLEAPK